MQVEQRRVDALIPYANNARTHSDAQVAKIAASIKEFGFNNPVLVDGQNGVIAGHGRLLAARKLGMAEVPCIELAHLNDHQRKAYILADNRMALDAGWDADLLTLELAELQDAGFDLELTGFSPEELRDMLAEPGEGDTGGGNVSLADRFLIPPFSVFNAREGWWQDRKREWIALGIRSERGRGGGLTMAAKQVATPGLNYYRDENRRQRRAVAQGPHATTVCANAATARDGR